MLLATPICSHAESARRITVHMDHNGMATGAFATVGECTTDIADGD